VSLKAKIKSDGHVCNGHVSNAQQLNVLEMPDFPAGVSQYLLVNINVHEEPKDYRLSSSGRLVIAAGGNK
jgi:glutamine synthetase type III